MLSLTEHLTLNCKSIPTLNSVTDKRKCDQIMIYDPYSFIDFTIQRDKQTFHTLIG